MRVYVKDFPVVLQNGEVEFRGKYVEIGSTYMHFTPRCNVESLLSSGVIDGGKAVKAGCSRGCQGVYGYNMDLLAMVKLTHTLPRGVRINPSEWTCLIFDSNPEDWSKHYVEEVFSLNPIHFNPSACEVVSVEDALDLVGLSLEMVEESSNLHCYKEWVKKHLS